MWPNTREGMLEPYNSFYKVLSILDDIKIQRFWQKGHIIAMEEERIPKMVPDG